MRIWTFLVKVSSFFVKITKTNDGSKNANNLGDNNIIMKGKIYLSIVYGKLNKNIQ